MTEADWKNCTEPHAMLGFLQTRGVSERKLRLFGCACIREVLPMVDEAGRHNTTLTERLADGQVSERQWNAAVCRTVLGRDIALTLRSGEDVDAENERERRRGMYTPVVRRLAAEASRFLVNLPPVEAAKQVAFATVAAVSEAAKTDPVLASTWRRTPLAKRKAPWASTKENARLDAEARARTIQACLLRDIFGPLPYRPMTISPSCLSPPALSLAQQAYDDRLLPAGTLDPGHLATLADALPAAGCNDAELLGHLRSPDNHVRGCFGVDAVLRRC